MSGGKYLIDKLWFCILGHISPRKPESRGGHMQNLEIRFRVPEGEEMTDERIEALGEAGISEDDVFSDGDGQVVIRCSFSEKK